MKVRPSRVGSLARAAICALAFFGVERIALAVCAWQTGTATALSINGTTCNVGINMTASSTFRLDLGGATRLAFDPTTANPDATTLLFGDGTGWKLHFGKRSDSGATKFLTIQDNGSVGIGTTSPTYKLHVYGGASSYAEATIQGGMVGDSGLRLLDGSSHSWKVGINLGQANASNFNIMDTSVGANRLAIDTFGYVGIGTTAPAARLDVNGTIGLANSGSSLLTGAQLRTYLSNDANWGISNTANGGGDQFHIRIHGYGGNLGVKRQFQVIDSSNANAVRFAVNFDTGNVTVGGGAAFAGTITGVSATFSGTVTGANIQAQYQDVAEWVPSRRKLEAGTVVVVDSERSNGIVSSELSYDTRVAGVISEKPGIVLGEGGEGKAMVATTGRVRVKVDAGTSSIRVGDLLVTSDREGFAMRSEPLKLGGIPIHRPGTLIGKALEPLERGQGEILVLLSLQ